MTEITLVGSGGNLTSCSIELDGSENAKKYLSTIGVNGTVKDPLTTNPNYNFSYLPASGEFQYTYTVENSGSLTALNLLPVAYAAGFTDAQFANTIIRGTYQKKYDIETIVPVTKSYTLTELVNTIANNTTALSGAIIKSNTGALSFDFKNQKEVLLANIVKVTSSSSGTSTPVVDSWKTVATISDWDYGNANNIQIGGCWTNEIKVLNNSKTYANGQTALQLASKLTTVGTHIKLGATEYISAGNHTGYFTDSPAFAIALNKIDGTPVENTCGLENQDIQILQSVYDSNSSLITLASPSNGSTPENCFTFSNGTIERYNVLGSGCGTDVVIPNTIGGINVTVIGMAAFDGKGLTSVTIPSTVTAIQGWGFNNNALTSVSLPSSLTTLDQNSFQSNMLTTISIPGSVHTIGAGSFYGNQLTSVSLNEGIVEIAGDAFAGNHISSIVIPNSTTTLEQGAFANNDLSEITISSSVTTLGIRAFGLQMNSLGNGIINGPASGYIYDVWNSSIDETSIFDKTKLTSYPNAPANTYVGGNISCPNGGPAEYCNYDDMGMAAQQFLISNAGSDGTHKLTQSIKINGVQNISSLSFCDGIGCSSISVNAGDIISFKQTGIYLNNNLLPQPYANFRNGTVGLYVYFADSWSVTTEQAHQVTIIPSSD